MHYQVDNGVVTKYYMAGASRIAMRKGTTLYYLLSDHLGSTSLTLNSSGTKIAELRYKAFGETRFSSGTTYTPYQFTAQRSETSLGLYFYQSRWYDPSLGRFTQPDSLVPGTNNAQSWDRYNYVGNNPVKNTDPDGHCYPLCTMAIGAAIGAMVGGIAYTVANHGQSFNYTEFAVAVGAGIIAGGLIGTGVGIIAAGTATAGVTTAAVVAETVATASSAIGAGTSATMTGLSYIANNPGEFETMPFVLQTGSSAIAGGVTSNPTSSFGAKAAWNIASAETSYLTTGEDHSLTGGIITAGTAFVATTLQFGVDASAEEMLMINRPIDLLNSPSGNVRTNIYGTLSGTSAGLIINGGAWLGNRYDEEYRH